MLSLLGVVCRLPTKYQRTKEEKRIPNDAHACEIAGDVNRQVKGVTGFTIFNRAAAGSFCRKKRDLMENIR